MTKTKGMKKRLLLSCAVLVIISVCWALGSILELQTTSTKILGSYVSVVLISVVLWRFPLRFYTMALTFDVFATAFGSVLNLYHYLGFYDRFVHYLSGIVLAEAGWILIRLLFRRFQLPDCPWMSLMFAFFFSAACAGFWEIYEFTADQILSTGMQGDNLNTMGDIVSGVLGALTHSLAAIGLRCKAQKH